MTGRTRELNLTFLVETTEQLTRGVEEAAVRRGVGVPMVGNPAGGYWIDPEL